MSTVLKDPILELVDELEVPRSSYETAVRRYEDLGRWLHDPAKARSAAHRPEVRAQGSFRLGTAIKPIRGEHYDLDLVCKLLDGVSLTTHTQAQLTEMLGADLDAYRRERGIVKPLEEKNRCWRVEYMDEIAFHLDALPAIPHSVVRQKQLSDLMVREGLVSTEAAALSRHALAITDRRLPNYRLIDRDWPTSNPEGFAQWFEGRMRLSPAALQKRALVEAVASIEQLPTYRWKTPLQGAIQLLKRHRDVMFLDQPDSKPISAIITMLAAMAYQGEDEVQTALTGVLARMAGAVRPARPRVPNPVNPAEDFADKWATSEGQKLQLEKNFFDWVEQAVADVELLSQASGRRLYDLAREKLRIELGRLKNEPAQPATTRVQVIQPAGSPRPWCA